MPTTTQQFTRTLAFATLFAFGAATSQAQSFTFTEDFESVSAPSSSLPAGWSEDDDVFDVQSTSIFGTSTQAVTVTSSPGDDTFAPYSGNSDNGIAASDWQDMTIEVSMATGNRPTASVPRFGMTARNQSDGTAYGFQFISGFGPNDDSVRLEIVRFTDTGGIETLAFTTTTGAIGDGSTMDTTFSVENDTQNDEILLSGEFVPDGNTGIAKSVTHTVAFTDTDAITSPGGISLYASNISDEGDFWWDDVNVTGTAVPEPQSYAMLLGVLVLAAVTLRRRRG